MTSTLLLFQVFLSWFGVPNTLAMCHILYMGQLSTFDPPSGTSCDFGTNTRADRSLYSTLKPSVLRWCAPQRPKPETCSPRTLYKPNTFKFPGARSETRSERSESFRSESGYGSDQARSTWSSVSAPAAFADRVPPDSSSRPPLSHERAAAPRHGAPSSPPMPRSLNPRSPARSTLARPPTRNAPSQAANGSPATLTAATGGGAAYVAVAAATSSGSSAMSACRRVQAPALRLSVSTFPPEWSLECSKGSEERSNSCGSSSSSCDTISSINSSDEDHGRSSR